MRRWPWLVGGGVVLALGLAVAVPYLWFVSAPGFAMRTLQQWGIDGALGAPQAVFASAGPVQVWRIGQGAGPPIVLVHGFGDAGAGWTSVAQDLAQDHHVLVLDLPGHGRSAPTDRAPTFEELLGGLEAVVDRVDGPVVLVGNSLGGWVCAAYAERHAGRIAGLVLVNNAGLTQSLDRDLLLPSDREGIRRKNLAVMGEHAPDLPGFMLDGLLEMHQGPRLSVLFDHLTHATPRLDGRIGGLPVPVAIIWGTPDPFFPVEGYLDRLRAERADARVTQLPGCGHAPQYSCPEETAAAIRTSLP